MKRGMNIQFSWIYVTIVGVILLIIAVTIIGNIKKNASYALTSDIKMYVDNSIRNIQLNHEGVSQINLPDTEIEIYCDTFSVGKADAGGWPLTDIIVFSPGLIKDQILGYSSSFQMPYETEYFTYITSPGVEYIFEDSDLGFKAYSFFPNNTDKAFKADNKEKNYHTRYIEFADTFDEKDVVKITLMDDSGLFPDSFGKISFGDDESYFLDRATLLGALYSQDIETYECNIKKTLRKLSVISRMKKDKLGEFKQKYANCPYDKTIDLLNQMALISEEEKTDMLSMKKIYVLAGSIKKENMLLQRLSCPMLY